ncbi:MAG: hypothetical protein ACXWES_05165 [Solirubrobacterales bacterium]
MKGRQTASVALLVAGLLCVLLGTLTFYLRSQVFDPNHFADHAVQTLDDSDVRDAASREITDEVINRVDPNLVTVKPLLQTGTAAFIDTGGFKTIFRRAVEAGNRAVFSGNDDALVTLANVGVLVQQSLARFKPELAKKVPEGLDTKLIDIGKGEAATDAAQVAEKISLAGLILPPLGIVLLLGSVWASENRRRATIRGGGGLAITALVAIVVLAVAHGVIASGITDDTDRGAFDAVWESFAGQLRNWYLVIGGLGVVVASAAASAFRPYDLGDPLRRIWGRISTEPESLRGRLLWAAGLALAGIVMVLSPGTVIDALVIIAGAYVISRAVSTVIALAAQPAATAVQAKKERRRIYKWGVVSVALAVGITAVLGGILAVQHAALTSDAGESKGCNGSEALCQKRLDEVSFPATHNSYAGVNYPGYVFPEQDNTIPQQMDAGIRGLWIDTYYGVPGKRVYTDTSKVDPALIEMVQAELGPEFTAAAARIRAQIAKPPANAKTKIYLCHAFCELGAVDAEETFVKIREFLEDNPNEVMIVDLEDYTTPADTQKAIDNAGLTPYIYKGPQGPPWPKLQEMIDSGGRVLLVSEHMTNGVPWYRPLEPTIQETPFDFKPADAGSPRDMTCKGGRGERSDTIFLINHWINTDPTPKPTNAQKVNAHDFLLERARRCERQRGRFPNVLNVDFYLQGDLFGVVDELNRDP